MRKLLLIGLVALGVACQKDYYLEDLNDANARIENLQGQLNDVSLELQQSIEDNRVKAEELVVLENRIIELNEEINELIVSGQLALEVLEADLLADFEYEVGLLNTQIAELQGQLADALEQTELDTDLIADLNNQITELENREPEVIIEYITTVETVYVSGGTTTVYQPTQFDASNSTLEQLLAEIERLQYNVDIIVEQQSQTVEGTWVTSGMTVGSATFGGQDQLYFTNNTLEVGDVITFEGYTDVHYTVSKIDVMYGAFYITFLDNNDGVDNNSIWASVADKNYLVGITMYVVQ